MASVGVGMTVMLGHGYWFWVLHFMCETALVVDAANGKLTLGPMFR